MAMAFVVDVLAFDPGTHLCSAHRGGIVGLRAAIEMNAGLMVQRILIAVTGRT